MTLVLPQRQRARQLFGFLAIFLVVWSVRATIGYSVDETIASPIGRAVYANFLKFGLWVVPAVVFAALVRKEAPARYLGISVAPSRAQWGICLAGLAGFLAAVAAFETTVGNKSLAWRGLAAMPMAPGLLQFFVSPLLEEILFRGLVMKELLALRPRLPAGMLTSLLFVGAHLPFWLTHGGPSAAMWSNALGVFLFSLVACWMFARTSSIWPPTVAHIANNLLAAMLVMSQG